MDNQQLFDDWFRRLLNVNMVRSEYGLGYPMGACCYRDILRHSEVKKALKMAWDEIMTQPEHGE